MGDDVNESLELSPIEEKFYPVAKLRIRDLVPQVWVDGK